MGHVAVASAPAPPELPYSPRLYQVDKDKLAALRVLRPYKPFIAAALAWIALFGIIRGFLLLVARYPAGWALYPVVIFLIAGRAGVFLQLMHEAAHGLIGPKGLNEWFGRWMGGAAIGLDLKGYAENHVRHHAYTNRACDPASDREKYTLCDIRDPALWWLFLRDVVGITAIRVRFLYENPAANRRVPALEGGMEEGDETYTAYRPAERPSWQDAALRWSAIVLVQAAIFVVLFRLDPVDYVLFWGVPLTAAHMLLMRVRGIAEHGLGVQLRVEKFGENNAGTFFTRSLGTPMARYRFAPLTWIERILIGSLNVYYHHEHHLFPRVPYYNLPVLHRLIAENEKAHNPLVFAKGYFHCLFFPRLRST